MWFGLPTRARNAAVRQAEPRPYRGEGKGAGDLEARPAAATIRLRTEVPTTRPMGCVMEPAGCPGGRLRRVSRLSGGARAGHCCSWAASGFALVSLARPARGLRPLGDPFVRR